MERGLGKVGLLPVVQRCYNGAVSSVVVRNGEYALSVGDATATMLIDDETEYTRIKSMFEVDVLESLLSDITQDDVFWDVGANVGVYSCLAGEGLPNGSVVAFEPHPANAARLRKNLVHNGIEATVFQRALSDSGGEVELAVAVESHTTSPGHNLIELNESVSEYGEDSNETVAAQMTHGDELVAEGEVPPPTVLKVDVEGAEYNALRGLEKTLKRDDCRVVYCEVHRKHLERFGASESELREFLMSCGFELRNLNDHDTKYHLRALKDPRT